MLAGGSTLQSPVSECAGSIPHRLVCDGQKFKVRVDSLNANYSFKYFGKEQGVAA